MHQNNTPTIANNRLLFNVMPFPLLSMAPALFAMLTVFLVRSSVFILTAVRMYLSSVTASVRRDV